MSHHQLPSLPSRRPTHRSPTAAARRALVAAGLTSLFVVGAAGAAVADDTPAPHGTPGVEVSGDQVTLTTSLDDALRACARLDEARTRLTGLLDRVQGDADTQGSVAWLRERAASASGDGHARRAAILGARADRRADRVDDLTAAIDRLAELDTTVCVPIEAAGR